LRVNWQYIVETESFSNEIENKMILDQIYAFQSLRFISDSKMKSHFQLKLKKQEDFTESSFY
jgi:hypothetical protein